ncbi:MAG: DNA topoisomerase IV subunit A [Burkholderiaceae bacterium]
MSELDLFGSDDLPDNPGDGTITLAEYAEQAYLDYAVSVVKGRALPDVSDGQKPVQRRILYAMNEMGLRENAKPVKSARVVGDVLGKFHPHGDTAAYDALVRMAQSFTLRYPLIDGQGNFGSRDGDGAAAMRYTEARLTRFAKLLLEEIDSGTVDFAPNYDGSTEEPLLLPARLPMVLMNGASGIAVGMATEIPPHNLKEVAAAAIAAIRKPKISTEELAQILPAPDFPGGGQIITPAQTIAEIYASGRGSIKVRGRYDYEDMARGQWQLVFHELPHGVSSQKVLEEIEELSNPKVKANKKALSADQQQLKQTLLSVLDAVRDESGKDAAVRLVFEPKTSKIGRDELLSVLLAYTSLESSTSINLVMIGIDGRPRQKSLADILVEWGQFRIKTVTRRTAFRLDKVLDRIHILEGRQLILLNIDEVIQIIRTADEPKQALIERFELTERQADDILDIRLRQLARLEAIKIEKELKELREEEKTLRGLLDDESAMRRQVISEIKADSKTYGDERRTLVEEAEKAVAEVKLVEDPVTVIVSEKGWVRARQGHGHDASQFNFKAGDGLYGAYEVLTTDLVFALATNGRVYTVAVNLLPSARGDGQPITSFVELEPGVRIEHTFAATPEAGVLFASASGNGFLTQAKDLVGRKRQGKALMTLSAGDQARRPAVFHPGMDQVLCLSQEGRALVFELGEVKVLKNGGRGVSLMGTEKKDLMQQAIVYGKQGVVVTGLGRGQKQVERAFSAAQLAAWSGSRSRKGRFLEPRIKKAKIEAVLPEKST